MIYVWINSRSQELNELSFFLVIHMLLDSIANIVYVWYVVLLVTLWLRIILMLVMRYTNLFNCMRYHYQQ